MERMWKLPNSTDDFLGLQEYDLHFFKRKKMIINAVRIDEMKLALPRLDSCTTMFFQKREKTLRQRDLNKINKQSRLHVATKNLCYKFLKDQIIPKIHTKY